MRLDRSGEKNLNPFDTHAIEAAMQIKEGGAVPVEEVVAVTMGPESAVRALHKAVVARRRPLGAADRRRARRLGRLRSGYALGQVLKKESPDLVLLGQQSDDGECYTMGAVVADHLQMPSLTQVIKIDVDRRQAALRAPGRVRLRHGRGRAAGRDQRRRRDQRAALPVSLKAIMGAKKKPLDQGPTGDAGIEAGRVGEGGSRTQVLALNPPPAKEKGTIIEDEDTNETVEKIVAWLDERKLI